MSAFSSRRELALGAALLGGVLLAPLGIASLRRARAERAELAAPALASAAAALAGGGLGLAAAVGGPVDGGTGPAGTDTDPAGTGWAGGEAGPAGAGLLDGGAGLLADAGLLDGGAAIFEKPTWSPASRAATYGALTTSACDRELKRRGIPHAPARGAPLVDRPVRLTGALHGVTFRGDGVARKARKQRSASPFDIADCRLVLVLDDLAAFLATRGVTEVVHVSMHRPAPAGAASKAKAAQQPAKKAPKGAGKAAKRAAAKATKPAAAPARPSQHALGLAIDVAAFVKADGARLDVKADWHGAIGAPPCGPGSAPKAPTPAALELRELVCAVFASGLFNVVLTPNANEAHADHFHFDIKRNARYFLLE
ncbi:extensin family protein [Sorangium sp. So ce1036]|uniref:extensin family protein n=1 Tax=Sorangium sp. So ce1036 TaxID=3133328 RepID=UPI003F093AA8